MTGPHTAALAGALAPALHDAHAHTVRIDVVDHDENGKPTHYVVEFGRYVSVDASSPIEALTAAMAKLRTALAVPNEH
jgi:hypothetical protein